MAQIPPCVSRRFLNRGKHRDSALEGDGVLARELVFAESGNDVAPGSVTECVGKPGDAVAG
jgi:hypothetical protein